MPKTREGKTATTQCRGRAPATPAACCAASARHHLFLFLKGLGIKQETLENFSRGPGSQHFLGDAFYTEPTKEVLEIGRAFVLINQSSIPRANREGLFRTDLVFWRVQLLINEDSKAYLYS